LIEAFRKKGVWCSFRVSGRLDDGGLTLGVLPTNRTSAKTPDSEGLGHGIDYAPAH
jgi:hypothetical protein